MKRALIIRVFSFFILFIFSGPLLSAQECQWLKQSNDNGTDYTISNATDAAGNTYMVSSSDGVFIDFGTTVLDNPAYLFGGPTAFLTKYDASGNLLWAKLLGSFDIAYAITMDAAGNLYVYGNFFDTAVSFGTDTLTNVSLYDNFLVKLDGSGNVIWARSEQESAATNGGDFAIGTVADNSGHVIVTGTYDSAVTIGSIHLAAAGGEGGVYVAKYDTAGNVLWASTSSGGYSAVNTLTLDNNDNIYIAGDLQAPSQSFGDSTITNVGGTDLFLAKYNADGTVQWVRDIEDSNYSDVSDIDADNSGNLYLAGLFTTPSITFDSYTITNVNGADGVPNAFVAKYSTSGTPIWAKAGAGNAGAMAIDILPSGYIVAGGVSLDTTSVFGADTLSAPGIFLAAYDSTGALYWLKGGSSSNLAYLSTLQHDAAGNIYGAGYFNGTLQADGHTVTDISTTGNDEIFVGRFSSVPAGIAPVSEQMLLSVYPNPTTDKINIVTQSSDVNYKLMNITGSLLQTGTLQQGTNSVSLNNIASGIYLLQLKDSNGNIKVTKVVKE